MTSKYFILHNDAKKSYMGKDGTTVTTADDAATFYWDNNNKTITLNDNNIGPYSLERVCESNCSGNGKCLHTKCVCNSGWTGVDCSQSTGGGSKIGMVIGIIAVVLILGGLGFYLYSQSGSGKKKRPNTIEMDEI